MGRVRDVVTDRATTVTKEGLPQRNGSFASAAAEGRGGEGRALGREEEEEAGDGGREAEGAQGPAAAAPAASRCADDAGTGEGAGHSSRGGGRRI